MKKLLIIEDEVSVAKQIKWGLGGDYDISVAAETDKARALIAAGVFPVVLLDLGLPPFPDDRKEGFNLLSEINSLSPHSKVIVITGHDKEETAVKAIELGAVDFCAKPIDLKLLKIIISRNFRIYELEDNNRRLREQSYSGESFFGMLGISSAIRKIFETIRMVGKTDYPVLIAGESGVGKEMAANAIHSISNRGAGPLVIINCGGIPENLLESELFGYERGAFTGAVSRKFGKIEQADNGTLFLDEIGELPLPLQVKILRFLQEGTIERVGGTTTISLDIRIIAATNINLANAVKEKRFREDLYFRLNVVPLEMPPLRDRAEDILVLANHFLRKETQQIQRGTVSFSPNATTALISYHWPGNVRELQNCIRRALGTTTRRIIEPFDLGLENARNEQHEPELLTLRQAREVAEIKTIRHAMALTGNNISQAARLLEISRPTLHDLLKKYGIGS